jgi:hypothetical protein
LVVLYYFGSNRKERLLNFPNRNVTPDRAVSSLKCYSKIPRPDPSLNFAE